MSNRVVHCVIYSHVWALENLDKLPQLGSLEKSAVVELAINSNLSASFIDSMKHRMGVGGLLRNNLNLNDIVEQVDGLAQPVAFAPRPPIPLGALSSAVGLLRSAQGNFDKVILMVNSMEALHLSACMAGADKFHVLWDLADAPTRSLAQTGEALAAQRLISTENWGGFTLYSHPKRPVIDEISVRQAFSKILEQYPQLSPNSPKVGTMA